MARDFYDYSPEDYYVDRDIHMSGVTMHRQGLSNFTGKGPKGWRRKDEDIREDACEVLLKSYDVDASEIEVNVKDRTVTLTGVVENREMKRAAGDAVSDVTGVEDVMNQLSLRQKEDHIKHARLA